jgi:hypothetical protein
MEQVTCKLQELFSYTSGIAQVSIVSDYRLDNWDLIPNKGKGFFLYPLCPDQLWGSPPVPTGAGGPFPRGTEQLGHDADHSYLPSAEVKN